MGERPIREFQSRIVNAEMAFQVFTRAPGACRLQAEMGYRLAGASFQSPNVALV